MGDWPLPQQKAFPPNLQVKICSCLKMFLFCTLAYHLILCLAADSLLSTKKIIVHALFMHWIILSQVGQHWQFKKESREHAGRGWNVVRCKD